MAGDVTLKMAEARYLENKAWWDRKVAQSEAAFAEDLGRPGYAESLGLPADLPESTIEILKRTMAGDRHADSMPTRAKVYRKFGLAAPD